MKELCIFTAFIKEESYESPLGTGADYLTEVCGLNCIDCDNSS